MKSLEQINLEIKAILQSNECEIVSEMGVEDVEDFPYLLRRAGVLIEKIKI